MENRAAVAYCRVSTQEQSSEGVSLDAQTERLEAYCRLAGLDLVATIREEGVSGGKPLDVRAGGREMLGMIRGGPRVGHVVSLKLDRLFRDTQDCLAQTRAWDKGGVVLHLVDLGGQPFNSGSAMGRFFLTLLGAVAELERNLISERTATSLKFKKAHRQAYGPVPYGWERQGDDLMPIEAEQAIIRQMKAWRQEGRSYRDIAAALNEAGIRTKAGSGKWHPSVVNKILRNDLHPSPDPDQHPAAAAIELPEAA
jgi:DNA invertase Pin-like site-specific DNA recombinase